MTDKVRKDLGLRMSRKAADREIFTIANQGSITAIGRVAAECSFARGFSCPTWQQFSIFKKLAEGIKMIMGKQFLEDTATLHSNRDRLLERTCGMKCWRMFDLSIESPKVVMECCLDLEPVYAKADTGSNADVVSLAYCKRRKFKIFQVAEDESWVELADGSLEQFCGMVKVKFDIFDNSAGTASQSSNKQQKKSPEQDTLQSDTESTQADDILNQTRNFFVFDGLHYDVVLGETLLDSIDAFNPSSGVLSLSER